MQPVVESEVHNTPSDLTRSIRICILADASTPHSVKWINHFSARGYDVHVLSFEPGPALSHNVQLQPLALNVHRNIRYFVAAWQARKLIAQIQPDILHAHYASGYGTLGRLIGLHPYVLSVWGTDVFEFPEISALHRSLLKRNLASADQVCSTSHIMAKQTAKYCRRPIAVTPFGVNCSQFTPRNGDSRSEAEFVIGTVKALEPYYGIEYLLQAFAQFTRRSPEARTRLIIAGDGSLKHSLKRLAQDLGIARITEFLGHVAPEKIPELLSRFTVFAALSIAESFGVAVLEASACGLPVVVTNVGGLPEVVKAGETGIIVPPRDPEAAGAAFSTLMANENLRCRLGNAGREYVLANYEWSENASRMEKLYARILRDTSRMV